VTVKDVDDTPTSVWGKIKKSFPGLCDVEARGDMDVKNTDCIDLDVRVNGFGTAVQMTGTACMYINSLVVRAWCFSFLYGVVLVVEVYAFSDLLCAFFLDSKSNTVKLEYVQVTKDVDTLGGTVTINPKYDLQSSTPDVKVGYAFDKTNFQIDAQSKKLTVAHSFANNQNISPSVTAAGDFSISYARDVENGRLTTTWTPNDSVKLQWSDGEWETTVRAPIEGYYKPNAGVKVNMKRKLDMDWGK
jgi:hypothetical protein